MKTVLITGAYRGLVYEVANQLSERDWRVIITARKAKPGAAAAKKLRNAFFLELDVSDAASVGRCAREVPDLDVLINNAAVIADNDQDILQINPRIIAETIETNALGALRVSQAFLSQLSKS